MAATFVIKAQHNGVMRRFNAPISHDGELDLNFDALKSKIVNLFEFPRDAKLSLTYVDEDGDIVTLANDEDLRYIVHQNLKFLKINVLQNNTNEPKPSVSTRNNISSSLSTFPDQLKEAVNQMLTKIFNEIPSEATELRDIVSKVGLNLLKNIPIKPQEVEVKPPSETPKAPILPTCPFSDVPLENKSTPSKPTGGACHIGVVCDNCGANPIIGARYKSILTHNFDLCETCFSKMGNPTGYQKMETPILLKCPFRGFPLFPPNPAVGACHVGIECDGCNALPIIGARFKSKTKFDFDLCEACFSKMGNSVEFERIETPVFSKPFNYCKGLRNMHSPSPLPAHCTRQGKEKLESRFIADVNIPDGTVISPGASFTKIWRLRNSGTVPWPRGTRLIWIGGDKLTDAGFVELETPDGGLHPTQEIDIAVDFSAPLLRGRYISYWRLISPFGAKFGQRVWVLVQVDASASDVNNVNFGLNVVPEPNRGNQTGSDVVSYPKVEAGPVRMSEETDEVLKQLGFKEVDSKMDADELAWASILNELDEMGFCDKEQNLRLLKKHNGSITGVVMDMLSE